MGRRVSPRHVAAFAVLLMIVGGLLWIWGASMPLFTDPARGHLAFSHWCDADYRVDDKVGDAYFAMMTNHYPLIDGGCGLIAGGSALLALTAALGWRRDRNWLRTPARRVTFLAIGLGVLMADWASGVRSIAVDQQRDMYPACADSIVIGLVGMAMLFMLLIPLCLLVGFLVTLKFGPLPVSLGRWDHERPGYSWTITILFGAFFAGLLWLVAAGVFSSMWPWTPAGIAALYIVESARSALLASSQAADSQ